MKKKTRSKLLVAMTFLLPNILGFLAFTCIPILLSFALSFSDWNIFRHNIFKTDPLNFIGLGNFFQLASDPDFWQALGNTFFFMMGLPFAVMGSLCAALILTRATTRPKSSKLAVIIASSVMGVSALILILGGFSFGILTLIFIVLAGSIFMGGILSGGIVYRTLFYLPHFTAGVATFILWKKLYNPYTGPINHGLGGLLDGLAQLSLAAPFLFTLVLPAVGVALLAFLFYWQARRLLLNWEEACSGPVAIMAGLAWPCFALGLILLWRGVPAWVSYGCAVGIGLICFIFILTRPRPWGTTPMAKGLGTEAALWMIGIPVTALAALAIAQGGAIPVLAQADRVNPPDWLGQYEWAKPALMIMALWAAIGSNNMILYLAGLGNIPPELYEAADIDGARPMQRFRFITWPQLAPITFFIVVMGVISGLQGGFEMARTMTEGGPAGATTTLSYFIFIGGFETGRLGYASAAAWILFFLVFFFSMLNFKFGNVRDTY